MILKKPKLLIIYKLLFSQNIIYNNYAHISFFFKEYINFHDFDFNQ